MVDHAIEFDFGAAGLGGNPDSTDVDGYYEIGVDGFSDHYFFDRLFGDINGDGTVDNTDVNLITPYLGTTTSQVDIDGAGLVTTYGRTLVQRARGHKLAAGLRLDARSRAARSSRPATLSGVAGLERFERTQPEGHP